MPVISEPPMYSPAAERTSKVVAVPKSTHTAGPAEARAQGDGVDEPVGADLARVVVADRHAGLQTWTDDEHLVAEIARGHRRPFRLQVGHGGGDDRGRQILEGEATQLQQVAQRGAELVGGGLAHRGKTPVLEQLLAAKVPKCVWVLPTSTTSSMAEDYGPSAPAALTPTKSGPCPGRRASQDARAGQ